MASEPEISDKQSPRGRLILGAVIFVTGQLAPLAIPLVSSSSLAATWKTALSGVLLLGIPEVAILLAIVVLGKEGFNALKSRLFGSAKSILFPDAVSRRRYYAGLILFSIPILFGWLSPYFYESFPALMRDRVSMAFTGDMALIAGIILMGGQFWEKLRAFVVYDAQAPVPSEVPEAVC